MIRRRVLLFAIGLSVALAAAGAAQLDPKALAIGHAATTAETHALMRQCNPGGIRKASDLQVAPSLRTCLYSPGLYAQLMEFSKPALTLHEQPDASVRGFILNQHPEPGEPLATGGALELWLSSGTPDTNTQTAPGTSPGGDTSGGSSNNPASNGGSGTTGSTTGGGPGTGGATTSGGGAATKGDPGSPNEAQPAGPDYRPPVVVTATHRTTDWRLIAAIAAAVLVVAVIGRALWPRPPLEPDSSQAPFHAEPAMPKLSCKFESGVARMRATGPLVQSPHISVRVAFENRAVVPTRFVTLSERRAT